jgi:hypothetical protein
MSRTERAGQPPIAAGPYRIFGLDLISDIPLPELDAAPSATTPDVVIRTGEVPRFRGTEEPPGLSVVGEGAILNIGSVGRYWIRGGREIVVAPAAGSSERNVRLYLLGSAFAAILHQRGLLPLHANAVEIDGRAVAFMGHSGAGKSTMAAWFHDRGFNILADDVCVVGLGDDKVFAHRGIPRLRLWREALEVSGRDPEAYESAFDDMDKYNVPTQSRSSSERLELSHVYLLGKSEGSGPRMDPLRGVEAVDALVANTYRGGYLPLMGGTQRHLGQCLALARRAPLFRADRLWGFDTFDEQASLLEAHARRIIALRA